MASAHPMRRIALTLPLALLGLGACASGSPDSAAPDAAMPDASTVVDASSGEPDAAPVSCQIRPIANIGSHPGYGLTTTFDEATKEWQITYDLDPAGVFRAGITLREGFGQFQNGVKTGKYDIIGADARYESCSLCVWAESSEDAADDELYRFQARLGTLQIESVDRDSGSISGALITVELSPFELSEENGQICTDHSDCGRTWCGLLTCVVQEPRPDVCGFSIGRLNF